jgi:hypothetical protein
MAKSRIEFLSKHSKTKGINSLKQRYGGYFREWSSVNVIIEPAVGKVNVPGLTLYIGFPCFE